MPPSKSDILPSEGGITPMWAVACGKYGIQGAFGALDDVFGGASEADRGARAQCASPLGAPLLDPPLPAAHSYRRPQQIACPSYKRFTPGPHRT